MQYAVWLLISSPFNQWILLFKGPVSDLFHPPKNNSIKLQKTTNLGPCLQSPVKKKKKLSSSLLLKVMLCFAFHMFERKPKQSGHEAVSDGGTNTYLGVLSLTFGRRERCTSQMADIQNCAFEHTLSEKQSRSVLERSKGRFHFKGALYKIQLFTLFLGKKKFAMHRTNTVMTVTCYMCRK